MSEILTSVQARAVWLERELEAMKKTLANQPKANLRSEYWKDPVKKHDKIGFQLPEGLGEVRHQDRALPQQPAALGEVRHQDRAVASRQPAGLGEVCQQGRALHGTVLGVQRPLSKECPDDPGAEDDGDSLFGAPNHGVQEGHQQLHNRHLCDPKGEGEGVDRKHLSFEKRVRRMHFDQQIQRFQCCHLWDRNMQPSKLQIGWLKSSQS